METKPGKRVKITKEYLDDAEANLGPDAEWGAWFFTEAEEECRELIRLARIGLWAEKLHRDAHVFIPEKERHIPLSKVLPPGLVKAFAKMLGKEEPSLGDLQGISYQLLYRTRGIGRATISALKSGSIRP